jgi:hypothetical protein
MKVKERKDLIIKQTSTTTNLSKPLVLVVISFLIVALIYSSFSRSYVAFAETKGPIICRVGYSGFIVYCCQTTTSDDGIEIRWCTMCDNTNPPSNCSPRQPDRNAPPPVLQPKLRPPVVTTEPPSVAPPNGSSQTVPGTIEQPPSTVKDNSNTTSPPSTSQRVFSPTGGCVPFGPTCIPCDPGLPSSTTDCIPSGDWRPSGNAPPTSETPIVDCTKNPNDPSCKPAELKPTVDCTKNSDDPLCKTVGITPPPSDSANLAPDNNKNNNPPSTEDNKPKGSELGQSIGGGLSATKKGNKDNSPTPPPCPTDNSPIPPNCTLKPKF